MSPFLESLTTIALAIVGLAMLAVLVSRKANTAGVFQSVASGFGNTLGVAEAPVTGASYAPVLSYPGQDMSTSFGGGG